MGGLRLKKRPSLKPVGNFSPPFMMTEFGEFVRCSCPVFGTPASTSLESRDWGRREGKLGVLATFRGVLKPGLSFVRLRPIHPNHWGLGCRGRRIQNLGLWLALGQGVAENEAGSGNRQSRDFSAVAAVRVGLAGLSPVS